MVFLFALPLGFHIPLLACYGWEKLRIPYIIAMPILFAAEMSALDWLFFEGRARILMFTVHAAFLGLVVLLSLVGAILEGARRLLEGPSNVENFVLAHLFFLLSIFIVPALSKTVALAQAI